MPLDCFDHADNARIRGGVHVTRNSAQPSNVGSSWREWPCQGFDSNNIKAMVSRSWAHTNEYTFAHWVWCNREYKTTANGTGLEGGWFQSRFSSYPFPQIWVDNGGDLRQNRVNYDTMAKADGATIAQIMWTLGHTKAEILANSYVVAAGWTLSELVSIDDINNAGTWEVVDGKDVLQGSTHYTVTSGSAGNPNEFWAAENIVWLQQDKIVNIPATSDRYLHLDAEWQDGRTGAHTIAFLQHVRALCNAKNIGLKVWPNSLANDGSIYSGFLASSLPDIVDTCDLLYLLSYDDADDDGQNYAQELDAMWEKLGTGAQPDKIGIAYGLGDPRPGGIDTTLQDAQYTRLFIERRGITNLTIWRYYQTPGGECDLKYNREIAAVLLGEGVPRSGPLLMML